MSREELQKQFDVIMLENLALLEREVELNKRIEELESDSKMVQDGVTTTMRENMELTIKVLSLEDVICGISESIDSLHNN